MNIKPNSTWEILNINLTMGFGLLVLYLVPTSKSQCFLCLFLSLSFSPLSSLPWSSSFLHLHHHNYLYLTFQCKFIKGSLTNVNFYTMPKHGKYDYISDWRYSPKPHIWLAMTTWLLIHMALWYLPLVTKNGIIINATCDYVLHNCKTI
jgi:hypothetical protein